MKVIIISVVSFQVVVAAMIMVDTIITMSPQAVVVAMVTVDIIINMETATIILRMRRRKLTIPHSRKISWRVRCLTIIIMNHMATNQMATIIKDTTTATITAITMAITITMPMKVETSM